MRRRIGVLAVVLGWLLVVAAQCPLIDDGAGAIDEGDPSLNLGAVRFSDDFEDGISSGWSRTPGWDVTDGCLWRHYTGSGEGYMYVTAGANWTDYVVDCRLDSNREDALIVVRCQEDLESFVQVGGDHRRIRWEVYEKGARVAESGYIEPGFFSGIQDVRVVVCGSQFALYVNGLLRSTFEDFRFSHGLPGLGQMGSATSASGSASFDYYTVTALEP